MAHDASVPHLEIVGIKHVGIGVLSHREDSFGRTRSKDGHPGRCVEHNVNAGYLESYSPQGIRRNES